jgi:hypothetical protein
VLRCGGKGSEELRREELDGAVGREVTRFSVEERS